VTAFLDGTDLFVVGSGLYGLTVAQQAASDGARVVVVERRQHLGGNAWSEPDPQTGIEVHVYGSHIFHTSNERVWLYVNRFTSFDDYRHHVWTTYQGRVYPMPINLATMSAFFGRGLSPQEARELLEREVAAAAVTEPESLEEKALSLVGRSLYDAFIRGYTAKQWQTDPRDLPPRIITRLPVRFSYDTRYFSDRWEGIPSAGYGNWLKAMAAHENIRLQLGVDWFDIRDRVPRDAPVVYTGPIDRYFDFRAGQLNWRTLDLEQEVLPVSDFQGTSVMNYADIDVPHTRIHEFKHFQPHRYTDVRQTIIMREYSRAAARGDEPYYPVDTADDRRKLSSYREMARAEPNVHFGGRLGSYQYLDMHMAIASALTAYETRIRPLLYQRRAPAS
jgi:UDP-galactopyranose mutase